MNKYKEAMKLMNKRFGQNVVISLATMERNPTTNVYRPCVRNVYSYYEDCTFYAVTYGKSRKMQQIAAEPEVALDVCYGWFSANGIGENLGWVRDKKNTEIMSKLRAVFAEWYGNGIVNEDDQNTCLLRINLTSGILFDQGKKYEIDFANETA